MKIKGYYFLILGVLFITGCFVKEQSLGNNFIVSEYDSEDVQILYSDKAYATSGIPVVPMTVLECAYDNRWIIAKSRSETNKADSYWIIDKNFKVALIRDNDSTFNIIRSHVTGPLNAAQFVKQLGLNNINLALRKI